MITPACSSTQPNEDWHEMSGDAPILNAEEDGEEDGGEDDDDDAVDNPPCIKTGKMIKKGEISVTEKFAMAKKKSQRKTSSGSCHLLEVRSPLQGEQLERRISADLSSGRTEQSFLAYI